MPHRPAVQSVRVQRHGHADRADEDLIVVEEPLEIRLEHGPANDRQQRSIAVTMRTPGNDLELVAGFLHGEGILRSSDDIYKLDWCANVGSPEEYGNVVKLELKPEVDVDLTRLDRNFYMSSSCGVCGKASIEALQMGGCPVVRDSGWRFEADWVTGLSKQAEAAQTVFQHTGGLHGASLFGPDGNWLLTREDVGRHNAVDKAIGTMFLRGKMPLNDHTLLVSGRAGFELVQKAVFAGLSLMVAVGAPTSLAVELARQHGLTLIGFLRGNRFNVYAGEFRMR